MRSKTKYYRINLNDDDGTIWKKMFQNVIKKCDFLEYSIGADVDTQIEGFEHKKHSFEETIALESQLLNHCGFLDNLECIYSSERNFTHEYDFEWRLARLSLDQKLKDYIAKRSNLLQLALIGDFEDLSSAEQLAIEFLDLSFYRKEEAIMYTVHSEMAAFILLTKLEKEALENEGIVFTGEEFEQQRITRAKAIRNFNTKQD